jgi:two-component system, LytTR family, response regulator LytT
MTNIENYKELIQQDKQVDLDELLNGLLKRIAFDDGKKSFLVFKNNKYFTVQTDVIAFIYIKHTSPTIMTFQEQEYPIVQSLDQVQALLSPRQFFRVNRQYLVNFDAIKEVEHYFARKLVVNLIIPSPELLLIGKEKTSSFFNWLENR